MMPAATPERRKELRVPLFVPVRTRGYDADGTAWEEPCTSNDASISGLSVKLKRPLDRGQILSLYFPMPDSLRQYDTGQPNYLVYGIVRDVRTLNGDNRAGLLFFGKQPPKGYRERPWTRYVLPSDVPPGPQLASDSPPPASHAPEAPGNERGSAAAPPEEPDPGGKRQAKRFDIFINFAIEQVDEWGTSLSDELSVAENISCGGARLKTSLKLGRGQEVVVYELGGNFETRAQVVNSYVGPDGVRRLNLRFLDGRSPDHLIH